MYTKIELKAGDGAAVDRLAATMASMGARVTRASGMLVIEAKAAPCAICRELHVESEMEDRPRLGGLICSVCAETATRIYRNAQRAASREMANLVPQIPQIIRDLRAGCEEPTYYRGLIG